MQTRASMSPQDIFFSFGNWEKFRSTNHTNFSNSTINSDLIVRNGYTIQEHYYIGQTITFVAIVLFQLFGNLLVTRTHRNSFFKHMPWSKKSRNLWLFPAQLVSIILLICVVFIKPINNLFKSRPIPVEFYFMPIGFAFLIFVMDELRKLFVRNKILWLHKVAW
jgi:sodium/potassium-transporting ATPase subunit alpha